MAKKKAARPKFDVLALPLERRQQILRDNPGLTPEDVGILPAKKAVAKKHRGHVQAKKSTVGRIVTDSRSEAAVFKALLARADVRGIILHGKVYLGEEDDCDVDGVAILETYPDGTFLGRLVDGKGGRWDNPMKPHSERDARKSYRWVKAQTGASVLMLSPAAAPTHPLRGILAPEGKKRVDDAEGRG